MALIGKPRPRTAKSLWRAYDTKYRRTGEGPDPRDPGTRPAFLRVLERSRRTTAPWRAQPFSSIGGPR